MNIIELSQRAQKFLNKLDRNIKDRIEGKLKELKINPVPSDAIFIGRHNNDKIFRCRIGSYRALYKLKIKERIILITKIDKRSRIYKGL